MELPPLELTDNPKNIKNKEKIFEINSNKNHKFNIVLKNKDPFLLIEASYDNSIQIEKYEEKHSLEYIKKNKFFSYFETIDEILDELFPLIDNKKVSLIEEANNITLIIQLPTNKIKDIRFDIKQIEKNDKDKINELYNIIMNIKNENKILKEENKDLKKRIENNENEIKKLIKRMEINENKVNEIEKENKKILDKKEKEIKIKNIDSKILTNYENIELINKRLKYNEILAKKDINYKLLYRATRDGDDASIFHQKCDNKCQVLAVFKTTKGLIFGGYTEVGYKGKNDGCVIDNKAFFFSCDLKKIYNVKNGKTAIYDFQNYGPTFGDCKNIYVSGKMLDCNCSTCSISSSCFDGINSDYEISNGEYNFKLQEIEVFQILYQ
jgi:hypothetical protein